MNINFYIFILYFLTLKSIINAMETQLFTQEECIKILEAPEVQSYFTKFNSFNITLKNAATQSGEFNCTMCNLFGILQNKTSVYQNKQDLWSLFIDHRFESIYQPIACFYYQQNQQITKNFINQINSFFDPITDEEVKKDAKIVTFYKIYRLSSAFNYLTKSKSCFVLLNNTQQKVFFYTPFFKVDNFPYLEVTDQKKWDEELKQKKLQHNSSFTYKTIIEQTSISAILLIIEHKNMMKQLTDIERDRDTLIANANNQVTHISTSILHMTGSNQDTKKIDLQEEIGESLTPLLNDLFDGEQNELCQSLSITISPFLSEKMFAIQNSFAQNSSNIEEFFNIFASVLAESSKEEIVKKAALLTYLKSPIFNDTYKKIVLLGYSNHKIQEQLNKSSGNLFVIDSASTEHTKYTLVYDFFEHLNFIHTLLDEKQPNNASQNNNTNKILGGVAGVTVLVTFALWYMHKYHKAKLPFQNQTAF